MRTGPTVPKPVSPGGEHFNLQGESKISEIYPLHQNISALESKPSKTSRNLHNFGWLFSHFWKQMTLTNVLVPLLAFG